MARDGNRENDEMDDLMNDNYEGGIQRNHDEQNRVDDSRQPTRTKRKWRTWAIAGGAVLLVFIVVIIILSVKSANSEDHIAENSTARSLTKNICTTNHSIFNKTEILKLPLSNEANPIPWLRENLMTEPILISSPEISNNWEYMLDIPVQGLNSTFRSVYTYFMNNSCIMLPWGGYVRDLLLGDFPTNIDAEFACSTQEACSLCKKEFGIACRCDLNGTHPIIRFGAKTDENGTIESLDTSNWNDTYFIDPFKWDYSINSLGFFSNNADIAVVVDLLGKGFDDVCNKTIRIAVENVGDNTDNWDKWYNGNTMQLLQFWQLREEGFTTIDNKTMDYIARKIKEDLKADAFLKFYCEIMRKGVFKDDQENLYCILKELSQNQDHSLRFEQLLKTDLGEDYWNSKMDPWIKNDLIPALIADSLDQIPKPCASERCIANFFVVVALCAIVFSYSA